MNKERLKAVLQQFTEQPLPILAPRTLAIPPDSGKVVTLIGARRKSVQARANCAVRQHVSGH
jgi:hypothetical protein